MPRPVTKTKANNAGNRAARSRYDFREQVGFLLRTSFQRHTAIFIARMGPRLTQTQLAVLACLRDSGPLPHNELGQQTALDASTVKGVVDRLKARGLVEAWTTPEDRRSRTVTLTTKGQRLFDKSIVLANEITRRTLKPLTAAEQKTLIGLLKRVSSPSGANR
jgi:DNA-binding MarR family transcriptional regulator